jgi:hypothetical protein
MAGLASLALLLAWSGAEPGRSGSAGLGLGPAPVAAASPVASPEGAASPVAGPVANASPVASPVANPAASAAAGGDTRSAGEGPGLVGSPVLAVGGVLALGLAAAGLTLLYVRATGGPGPSR